MTCCHNLDIPKAVKKPGYFDPTTAEIRGLDYKFAQPEVPAAAPVAKPKPQPNPKGHGPVQLALHHIFNLPVHKQSNALHLAYQCY